MNPLSTLRAAFLALFALFALAPAVIAQDHPGRQGQDRQAQDRQAQDRPGRQERPAQSEPAGDPRGVLRLLPADSVTEKQITVGGKTISYTATAGTLSLYDQSGERSAAVFYTAYVLKGADTAKRPLTFAFNGGPGAASAFLHLGLVGPRIADFGPSGYDGASAKLKDNPDTWLSFTDLVLIDPVSTGWSKPAKPDLGSAFHTVNSDADSMAKVVALYVAHNSRQPSPKYLLGESYGGFRAAKVARALQADQGIVATGVVMVSPLLETSFLWGSGREPLRAALQFPSYVAAELDRTKKFTPEALADAERFALNEYLPALAGSPLSGDKAQAFYGRIAKLTGITPDAAAKSRGYIRSAYLKHLNDEGIQVSSYDASLAMPDPFPKDEVAGDPVLDGYVRALSGLFVGYARDDLGFKTEMTYVLLNHEQWDWGKGRERPGVSGDLRSLIAFDPSFKVLVAHGRSDLVTPYGVSRYLLDQLKPVEAPDRVQLKTYRGGHMFYFNDDARQAFTEAVKAFYQAAP